MPITPTGVERFFKASEVIVSKTDTRGRITYANHVFLKVASYTEEEVLGKPHSIVRHPGMPRAVFKLLWDTIASGEEIFAYVLNMAKNGDHYWVFAHVTPTLADDGAIIGYHSNRRVPERRAVDAAAALYKAVLAEEQRHADPRKGLEAGFKLLVDLLQSKKMAYEEFVWTL